jgi:hypothetical protein
MRRERWEAFSGADGSAVQESEIVSSELDEDAVAAEWQRPSPLSNNGESIASDEIEPTSAGSRREGRASGDDGASDLANEAIKRDAPPEPIRPFSDLPCPRYPTT